MIMPASAHRPLDPPAAERLAAQRFVLVSPSHAGNIGSVCRAMTAMGLADLVVSAPREPAFATDPQAVALASGATALLATARIVPDLASAVADCELVIAVSAEPREFGPPPLPPAQAAEQAWQALASGRARRVAWVFGPERTGLSIADVALSQRVVTIPADPAFTSLNLSQAVQILAYVLRERALADRGLPESGREAAADREVMAGREPAADHGPAPARRLHPKAAEAEALADQAAVEAFHRHFESALIAIDFLDPAHPKKLMARMRRLFARAGLERAEVELLRGVCRQIELAAGMGRGGSKPPGRGGCD